MSTKIVCEIDKDEGGDPSILPFPMKTHKKQPESLGDYVRRIAKEKNLSHVKIADRAKKLGGTLSSGYVNSVIQGHVTSPKVETLKNLALGLGVPEDDLFEVARGKRPSDDAGFRIGLFAMLHREHQKLNEEQKKEVQPLIELLTREIQRRI